MDILPVILKWLGLFFSAAQQGLVLVGSLLAAASPALPFLLPMIIRRITQGNPTAASDAVSRVALLATTRYTQILAERLKAARDPSSPGGATITDAERFQATVMAGKEAALAIPPEDMETSLEFVVNEAVGRLKKRGELNNAVKAYDGDEALVRDSIRQRVLAKAPVTPEDARSAQLEAEITRAHGA